MIEVVSRSCLVLIIICVSQFPVRAQATSGPSPKSRVISEVNILTSGDKAPAGVAPVRGHAHEEASKASYDLGVRYGLAGRYKEAMEAFREAILYKPTYADAHFGLGHAYYDAGRFKEAAEAFMQAVALNPKDFDSIVYLGASRFRQGLYEQAVEAFKRAILIKPKSADVRYNIANAFHRMGRYEPAATYYADIKSLRPATAELYNDLGAAYGESGKYEKALEALRLATDNDSDDAYAHNNLGIAYYLVGRYADAAKALERAVRLAPNDPVIQSNLRQTSFNGGGATGEHVALVNTGVVGTDSKGLRWLSRSDVVRGLVGEDNRYASTDPPAAEAKNNSAPPHKGVTPEVEPAVTNAPTAKVVPLRTDTAHAEKKVAPPPSDLYRLGVGDVLDIRLLNERTDKSTLYRVLPGGLLEYPLFSEPLSVEGQTVEEAAERIAQELRRRAIEDDPRVLVNVREYVSHAVIVSGLVAEPGTKILKREEVPLYVLIADAQPLPEAGRVLVTSHATGLRTEVALEDQAAMAVPVRRGDVLMVTKMSQQFYYVSGGVVSPGQKEFHPEITLTQAIIAAGGELHRLRTVTLWSNRNVPQTGVIAPPEDKGAQSPKGGGLLTSTTYNMRDILSGKVPDPRITPGDRVEARR
ncbi:MAG TPA: tetratricopeptide repeat protein [Pyrinomonadaceae bacterium]